MAEEVFWKEKADPKMRDCGSADVETLVFWIISTLTKLGKMDLVHSLHEAVVAAREERDKALGATTKKDAWAVFYDPAMNSYAKALDAVNAIEAKLKEAENNAHCYAFWLHSRLIGEFQFLQIELFVKN